MFGCGGKQGRRVASGGTHACDLHTTPLFLLLCYEGLAACHVLLDEAFFLAGDGLGKLLPLLIGHVGQGHPESGDRSGLQKFRQKKKTIRVKATIEQLLVFLSLLLTARCRLM